MDNTCIKRATWFNYEFLLHIKSIQNLYITNIQTTSNINKSSQGLPL